MSVRKRGRLSIEIGLLVGGVAVYVVLSAAGGIADTLDVLKRMDPWWLMAAGAAEIISYVPLGAHVRRLTGGALGLTRSTGISLVWFGLGNLLPGAPAPGPRGGRLIAAAGVLRTRIVAVIPPRSHPSDPRIRPAQPRTSHHSPPIFLAE